MMIKDKYNDRYLNGDGVGMGDTLNGNVVGMGKKGCLRAPL